MLFHPLKSNQSNDLKDCMRFGGFVSTPLVTIQALQKRMAQGVPNACMQ